MFRPIKILDIDVAHPLTDVEGLENYGLLKALVRVHGAPVGYVTIPVIEGRCTASDIARAILKNHSRSIMRNFLSNFLACLPHAEMPTLDDLPKIRDIPFEGPMPLVTVAVCTRDNPDALALCLDSLGRLHYPNLDILVVDNAPSSDATETLVRTSHQDMRHILEPRPGLNWARNRAIIEARGEIIAYTDDDVVVDPLWVQSLVRIFTENPEVMAVTGLVIPYELETEAQALFELYGGFGKGFERNWFRADPSDHRKLAALHGGTGKFGTGANMAFRLELFNQIGHFDPALDVGTVTNGGGDLEIFFRVLKEGHTLVYEPAAIVRHRHRKEYGQLKIQLSNWGIGFTAYVIRNAVIYPDERISFLRLWLWWLCRRIIKYLLSSLFPHRLRKLRSAELKGFMIGLLRYPRARSQSKRILNDYGPQVENAVQMQNTFRMVERPIESPVAVRSIDISKPLKEIMNISHYCSVRLFIMWDTSLLGRIDIPTLQQPIGVNRLIQAIVEGIGLRIYDPDYTQSHEALWSEADTALKHYLMPHGAISAPVKLPEDIIVSIVVATYDRPDDLRTCLRHLAAQNSPRHVEIIVVDNNPGSGMTPPIVKEFPGVVLVKESRKGLSYARNSGICKSKGDVIVSIDDDVTMPPEWLENLIAPFIRSEVMVVTGNVLPTELETPAQQLFEQYGGLGRGFEPLEGNREWFESSVWRALPTWNFGATANAAFRASIFNNPLIGLMDEALGAGTPAGCSEDTYTFYRVLKAGYKIIYNPRACVWHKHRRSSAALRRQIYNYSKGHVAYHLTTLLRDHDLRALSRLFIDLPRFHTRRIVQRIFGKKVFPLSLVFMEIAGNLVGPFALWRSRQRVKRLGHSQPYIPPHQRSAHVRESKL